MKHKLHLTDRMTRSGRVLAAICGSPSGQKKKRKDLINHPSEIFCGTCLDCHEFATKLLMEKITNENESLTSHHRNTKASLWAQLKFPKGLAYRRRDPGGNVRHQAVKHEEVVPDAGVVPAQAAMGSFQEEDQILSPHVTKNISWYKKATRQNYAMIAQFALGRILLVPRQKLKTT